jgi:hypothetical protein
LPTPAYLDTALYLAAGGVNGFEVNGFPVNGVGFVDNPFAGVDFELDPYRSILPMDRGGASLGSVAPSLTPVERDISIQGFEVREAVLWANPRLSEVEFERSQALLEATPNSLELSTESVSCVAFEPRISYVLAVHPSTKDADITSSSVSKTLSSQKPDELDITVVPPEDRRSIVRRI